MVFRPMDDAELARWHRDELSEAFPPQERKPFADILALMAAGRYEPLGLFLRGRLMGYAAIWSEPGSCCALTDYLGVSASLRGGGLGSDILRRLIARYPDKRIVVEAELPAEDDSAENLLRRRRIGFYVRNGFTPAYVMGACGMRLQVLVSGGMPDSAALPRIMAAHSALYAAVSRADAVIPLPPDMEPPMPYWMNETTAVDKRLPAAGTIEHEKSSGRR